MEYHFKYNLLKAFILFEYTVCISDLMYTDIHKSLSYETFASLYWNTEFYTKTAEIRLKEESWFACFLMDFMHNLTLPARSRRLWWVSWSLYHTATIFQTWNFLHCIIFFLVQPSTFITINLFMTSKNEFSNSPILEFKVLHKSQRAF